MQKTPSYRDLALWALLTAAGCSEDTTPTRDGGSDHEGDKFDGGGDGDGDGGVGADTTAKLGDNVAGKACGSAADCQGTNAKCVTSVGGLLGFGATATPGGYCSGDCAQDSDCGAGGVCSGSQLGMGSCRRACDKDADCTRSGYYCAAGLNLQLVTLPDSCLPRPETDKLGDGIVGKACTSDRNCGDGRCADTIGGASGFGMSYGDVPAPDGYCTGSCLQDSECGANGKCVTFLPNEPGECYLECGAACDKREGYHCGPVFATGGGNRGGNGGGVFGGGGGAGVDIPNVCMPKPVSDGGMPDGGSHHDGGTEHDGGTDAGHHDAGPDGGHS
ncbi:MAG: hypothetical protein QM778_24555 [Myxococcales bacterium]